MFSNKQRLDKDIDAISNLVRGAWNLYGGDSPTEGASAS
jgi:hypothetical protein